MAETKRNLWRSSRGSQQFALEQFALDGLTDINEANKRNRELMEDISELSNGVSEKEEELRNKCSQISTLQMEREKVERKIVDLTISNGNLQEKVGIIESKWMECQETIKRMEVPLYNNNENIMKSLRDTITEKNEEIAVIRAEKEELDKNLSLYKLRYETLEKQLQNQKFNRNNLAVLEERNQRLQDQVDTLQGFCYLKESSPINSDANNGNIPPAESVYLAAEDLSVTWQHEIKELSRRIELLENQHCRPTDTRLILKKVDGLFGIRFETKGKQVLLGESRLRIHSVNPNHIASPLGANVVGDYVIMVNDINVQNFNMNEMKGLISGSDETLNMVTRKHQQQIVSELNFSLNTMAHHASYRDLGINLAVSMTMEKDSPALALGLCDMDELLLVNDRFNAEANSIVDIKSRIFKCVKQQQCKLTVRRFVNADQFRKCSVIPGGHDFRSPRPSITSIASASSQDLSPSRKVSNTLSPLRKVSNTQSPPRKESYTQSPLPVVRPKLDLPKSSSDPPHRKKSNTGWNFTEDYSTGYSRVITHEVSQDGTSGGSSFKLDAQYEEKEIVVPKEVFESFGLDIIGGNQTGIFVKSVRHWLPAQRCNVQVGWKLIQINGLSMKKVAFCYAFEILQGLSNEKTATFKFELTPMEYYNAIMERRPYDKFHVSTVASYTATSSEEMSFGPNEILCITDSYVSTDPGQPYRWRAVKDEGKLEKSGLVPRQITNRAKAIVEHNYEVIGGDAPERSPTLSKRSGFTLPSFLKKDSRMKDVYYKVLESVGEVLV